MIQLRDYQNDQVRQLYATIRGGNRRVIVCSPTGSGKRIVACWNAIQIVEKGGRMLFVTDRRLLVNQMASESKDHGIPYGLIMADEPTNESAPVQIASIQTLQRRNWMECPAANWIIVDEAHKSPEAYAELFKQYESSNPVIVGFTATPVCSDGRLIKGWGGIVETVTNSQLIASGHLLRTIVLAPFEPSLEGVRLSAGDCSSEIAARIKQCVVFADVFKYFAPYDTRQFIAFTPGVDFARGLAEQFTERGYRCEVICAATTQRERDSMFARYESGDLQGLVSVDVLREGFDAPEAQVGIDIQPNYQLRTFWQKVGRVKRPHEGQDAAVWLDFAGNIWRHIHPDEDPEWPAGDTTTRELVEHRKERESSESKEPWSCPSCAYQLSRWETLRGGKCPNCGHELKPAKRRIRFENGEMKTVSAKHKKKRQTDDNVKLWFSCLYPAIYSGKPLNLARVIYKSKCGQWPNHELLPKCPEPSSPEWRQKARDVYPELVK